MPEPQPSHMLTPGSGVLVDVHAAGVSFPELLQTRGQYQLKPELPFVTGSEVAGIVRSASDDADVRDFLSTVLVDHGAAVRIAGSVDQALELFGAERMSVVVADLAMPGRDGFELMRLLRQQRLSVPVIALTALAGVEDRKRAAGAGFSLFLSKPVEEGHLIAAIRHAAEVPHPG